MPRKEISETLIESFLRGGAAFQREATSDFKEKILMKQIEGMITPKAPTTKVVGDKMYQWNPRTDKWEDTGIAKEPKKEKFPTKRETDIAQKRLFREFMGFQLQQAPETKGIERLPFVSSKREIIEGALKGESQYLTAKGKINVRKLFSKLETSVEEFRKFSTENFPDEAKIAFPERRRLLK